MEPKRAARTGSAERHGSKRELTGINCVLVIYSTVNKTHKSPAFGSSTPTVCQRSCDRRSYV